VILVHPPYMSELSQFITTTVHFRKFEKMNKLILWLVIFLTSYLRVYNKSMFDFVSFGANIFMRILLFVYFLLFKIIK